jgi:hypothetical protein
LRDFRGACAFLHAVERWCSISERGEGAPPGSITCVAGMAYRGCRSGHFHFIIIIAAHYQKTTAVLGKALLSPGHGGGARTTCDSHATTFQCAPTDPPITSSFHSSIASEIRGLSVVPSTNSSLHFGYTRLYNDMHTVSICVMGASK